MIYLNGPTLFLRKSTTIFCGKRFDLYPTEELYARVSNKLNMMLMSCCCICVYVLVVTLLSTDVDKVLSRYHNLLSISDKTNGDMPQKKIAETDIGIPNAWKG